ncbi:diaminopimelate epimerase [Flagellimonas allohymeniacidonis]|uniref:Diaminopimelate epimerase n=1 Tax=Flagellimonas allohymeniacidonis TaxID=2517819 RepID=A0A4Q8QF54_9FLAO|nr:diaminopimelate epimerase [Allomuricauda hymeniacidonis]TAI49091.1 diaminopimelate epimerase [Allomuricauda hymeniacidonis]
MKLDFFKYQGTGNDFVLVDNRHEIFPKNDTKLIAKICDRRFGVGADGLILLENDRMTDFKMVYYNSDGGESTMCGNGGRCLVAFAKYLGIIDTEATFVAIDGIHTAQIRGDIVKLKMQDVEEIKVKPQYSFLDTGSPHHVQLVDALDDMDVPSEGAKLRYGLYGKPGSNINFVSQSGADSFNVRTYERGVENETLSCGTGVTAVALAMHRAGKTVSNQVQVNTPGGELEISFDVANSGYTEIYLKGPATQVFKGTLEW